MELEEFEVVCQRVIGIGDRRVACYSQILHFLEPKNPLAHRSRAGRCDPEVVNFKSRRANFASSPAEDTGGMFSELQIMMSVLDASH